MSDPDTTTPYLDGHCSTRGHPDHYHNTCPHRIRTQFGVELKCSCSAHDNDKEESAD